MTEPTRSEDATLRALQRSIDEHGAPEADEVIAQFHELEKQGLVERVGGDDDNPVWRLTDEGTAAAEKVIDRLNAEDN